MESAFVLLVILGIFGAIGYVVIRLLRPVIKPAKYPTLSEVLGVPGGRKIIFERHGRTFVAKFIPGYKSSPNQVSLLTKPDTGIVQHSPNPDSAFERDRVEVQPRMVLRAETSTDRWGKDKGLNQEIQIGDADFDSKIYIESNSDEAIVRRTLANQALRLCIIDLISSGVRELVLDDTGLYVRLKFESVDADGPFIKNVLPKLAEIANLLPLFAPRKIAKPSHYYFELVTGTVAAGIFLFLVSERITEPMGDALKLWAAGIGLILAAAITYVAMKTLRGTSISLRRVSSIGIFAIILCPLGSYWLIAYFNHAYDNAPAVNQRSTIARAWTSTYKSSTYYHIEVKSWHPSEVGVELYVSESFSKFATPGKTVEVTTHPGRFGFEWIESYRISRVDK